MEFLPGNNAPEVWVWDILRGNLDDIAPELGSNTGQLAAEISKWDSIYDSASDSSSNIAKIKLRELAESLSWNASDICRLVAKQETTRRESDIQPLVEGLENALLQWRAT